MQDMVAVISLRFEDEFSIDSLTEDLKDILSYPINLDQMIRNLCLTFKLAEGSGYLTSHRLTLCEHEPGHLDSPGCFF